MKVLIIKVTIVSHVTWKNIIILGTCPHKSHKPHKSKTIFALEVGKGPYATLIKLGVWGENTLRGGGALWARKCFFGVHFVLFWGQVFKFFI